MRTQTRKAEHELSNVVSSGQYQNYRTKSIVTAKLYARIPILMLAFVKHFISALFFLALGFTFLGMGDSAKLSTQTFAPQLTGIVYCFFALLHFSALFNTQWISRKEKNTQHKSIWNRSKIPEYKHFVLERISKSWHNFDQKSRKKSFRKRIWLFQEEFSPTGVNAFIMWQILELGALTIQAAGASRSIVDSQIIFAYATGVSLYSWICPWFFFVQNPFVRTTVLMYMSSLFGFFLSIGIPLIVLVPSIIQNLILGSMMFNDVEWLTQMLLFGRSQCPSSLAQLILKIVIYTSGYLTQRRLVKSIQYLPMIPKIQKEVKKERNLDQQESAKKRLIPNIITVISVIPQDITKKRTTFTSVLQNKAKVLHTTIPNVFEFRNKRMLKLYLLAIIIWGFFVMSTSCYSLWFRQKCPNGCIYQFYPWFDSSCQCAYFQINCIKLGIPGFTVDHLLEDPVLGPNLMTIHIKHCDIANGIQDKTIQRHQKLYAIVAEYTNMSTWNANRDVLPIGFSLLRIRYSNLKEIPGILRSAPPNLQMIGIIGCDIESIPLGIIQSWKLASILSLSELNLQEVPNGISNLTGLQYLSLYNNNISVIPHGIGDLPFLQFLDVSANSINVFPIEIIHQNTKLQIDLALNPITEIPSGVESSMLNSRQIVIDGTMYCNQLNELVDKSKLPSFNFKYVCLDACSLECNALHIGDHICDLPCNTEKCQWDGGDCG